MIAKKRSMRLKPGRVSGCIKHRFRREFTDLNTKQKMLWRNFCCGNGCRIRRCCETMENRRNYTSSASQIQTEDKRLQSGTNSGGRTWEKAGSSREQRCSKKNSEKRDLRKCLGGRDRTRNLKGAFGVTNPGFRKNVCWSSMIFIQPEIPYTEWQRC